MDTMYIYLNSTDYSGFHSNNKGTDFVVTLPTAYFFNRDECWEIGLLDIYMEIPTTTILSNSILNSMIHFCCDVVESSVFNEKQVNLLTTVRIKDCYNAVFEPGHVRYVPLAQDRLANLHLYLKDSRGNSVSVQSLVTHCTLHIRRK